jgi:hypothetical protein
MTSPSIGCDRVKVAMERLSRGSYRLTMPRICCGRVDATEGYL